MYSNGKLYHIPLGSCNVFGELWLWLSVLNYKISLGLRCESVAYTQLKASCIVIRTMFDYYFVKDPHLVKSYENVLRQKFRNLNCKTMNLRMQQFCHDTVYLQVSL